VLLREQRKVQCGRVRRVGPQHFDHLIEGVFVLFTRMRNDSVMGRDEREVAHVRVISHEQDADISCDAGEDYFLGAQVLQQKIEACAVEP
jgi:hypothetical protein